MYDLTLPEFHLISSAYAQAGGPGGGAAMGNLIFMVLLFAIFYFLLIRPQQKQAKAHKEMVENLQRGDSIITGGGIVGRVHRVEDDIAVVEVGEVEVSAKTYRPMRLKVNKNTIATVTAKAGIDADAAQSKKADEKAG